MICLSKSEISELTGKVRFSAQARALRSMGIDFKIRPDGSIMVYRKDIEAETASKTAEPDFGAMDVAS